MGLDFISFNNSHTQSLISYKLRYLSMDNVVGCIVLVCNRIRVAWYVKGLLTIEVAVSYDSREFR